MEGWLERGGSVVGVFITAPLPLVDCRRVYGYPPLVRLAPPGRLVDRLLPLLVGRLSRPVVLNPTIYIYRLLSEIRLVVLKSNTSMVNSSK